MPRNDRTPLAIKLDEKNHVEEPLLQQLAGLKLNAVSLYTSIKGGKHYDHCFR